MSNRSLYTTSERHCGHDSKGQRAPLQQLVAHVDTEDLVEQWGQGVREAAAEREQRRLFNCTCGGSVFTLIPYADAPSWYMQYVYRCNDCQQVYSGE